MEEGPCNTNLTLGPGSATIKPADRIKSTPAALFSPAPFPIWPKEEEIRVPLKTKEEEAASNTRGADRKKLRLSKEQSVLLESSFRQRNTLTPVQKQELADRLNLRPRQVEVWFQNRRARTKLKQTEADREILKQYCENLSEENRRLKKELHELKSSKIPKTALPWAVCPCCQMISASERGENLNACRVNPRN